MISSSLTHVIEYLLLCGGVAEGRLNRFFLLNSLIINSHYRIGAIFLLVKYNPDFIMIETDCTIRHYHFCITFDSEKESYMCYAFWVPLWSVYKEFFKIPLISSGSVLLIVLWYFMFSAVLSIFATFWDN